MKLLLLMIFLPLSIFAYNGYTLKDIKGLDSLIILSIDSGLVSDTLTFIKDQFEELDDIQKENISNAMKVKGRVLKLAKSVPYEYAEIFVISIIPHNRLEIRWGALSQMQGSDSYYLVPSGRLLLIGKHAGSIIF